MIVAMAESASEEQIQQVIERLVNMGFEIHRSTGARQTVLGAVGARVDFDIRDIEVLPGVGEVHRISSPYKLAGRSFRPEGTTVRFGNGLAVGGKDIVVMAGPCSVESQEQISTIAGLVAKAGARVLRGGAYKPRSSPYSFQGLGEEALKLLRAAADEHKLLAISEVMEISPIPIIKKLSHLPMTADPSHRTGRRDKVPPMGRAAVAAGADALLIEVHNSPENALSDGAQSLYPEQFSKLMDELRMIAPAVGRSIA